MTVSDVPAERLKELRVRSAACRSTRSTAPAAARAACAPGDVILAVNNVEVGNAQQFNEQVAKLDPKRNAVLLVRRGEQSTFVIIRPSDR